MQGFMTRVKFFVVLIGLVVIFKGQLTNLVQSLLDKAASQAGAI